MEREPRPERAHRIEIARRSNHERRLVEQTEAALKIIRNLPAQCFDVPVVVVVVAVFVACVGRRRYIVGAERASNSVRAARRLYLN